MKIVDDPLLISDPVLSVCLCSVEEVLVTSECQDIREDVCMMASAHFHTRYGRHSYHTEMQF